jgi:Zn-dependent protease with chaperone function
MYRILLTMLFSALFVPTGLRAQEPTDAGTNSQEELERLHGLVTQFAVHVCQDINPAVTIIVSDPKLVAQVKENPRVTKILDAGVTLDEYLRAALIVHCLGEQKEFKLPAFRWAVQKSPVVNAFTNAKTKSVVLTTGIIDFTRSDPGELAFVVGHELGHLADQPLGCVSALQRERIVAHTRIGAQRACEARADNIGFQYLLGAGFDGYDAAASFGRLQMSHRQPGLLTQFALDHPIDADRIENLRVLFARMMQTPQGTPTVR